MFNLDLKKAEAALNAGRLDEAYAMLKSTPQRAHADGQRMIDRLVAALLQRGNAHYQQQRYLEARSDAALAKQIGGPQVEIAELMQQVNAREDSVAEKTFQRTKEEVVARLKQLLQQQQNHPAMELLATLPQATQADSEIQRLSHEVTSNVHSHIATDIESGRLERAGGSLNSLKRAGIDDNETWQLGEVLQRFDEIAKDVRESDYIGAARKLKLQQRVIPNAKWIGEAIAAADQCIASVEQMLSGPLGFVLPDVNRGEGQSNSPTDKPNAKFRGNALGSLSPVPNATANVQPQTILHVDQVGSLLVLTGSRILVGTTTSSRSGGRSDIVLQTEGGSDVEIIRSGGDYLARSQSKFIVNGKSSSQHLLAHNDSIEIGKRGRLKFMQSVAASDSAVLKITGSKMKQRQIRSIVLLGESLVLAPTSGHFRLPSLQRRLIFSPTTTAGSFVIHQQGNADRISLTPHAPANIDGCRFTSQRSVS